MTPVSPVPIGTLIADRFAVKRVIGQGGMACVVAAEDMRLHRTVAVKIFTGGQILGGPLVARFLREAQAMARLRNEHVVEVSDVGTLPHGVPYFVMEYVEGVSLAVRLAVSAPPSVEEVLDYALQTLEALSEAHRLGIVHRDLKPENLMLTQSEDGAPLIKVIDFGISKLLAPDTSTPELTVRASFLGSPRYASPEQLQSTRDVDARTDIWSLGVVLYELLSGRRPFEAASMEAIFSAVHFRDPEPISELVPGIPSELALAVMRCLEKDPADRFASVQELTRALAPLATEPHLAVSVQRILRTRSSAPPPAEVPSIHPTATTITAPGSAMSADMSTGRRFGPWLLVAGAALVFLGVSVHRARSVTPEAPAEVGRTTSALPARPAVAAEGMRLDVQALQPAYVPSAAPAPSAVPPRSLPSRVPARTQRAAAGAPPGSAALPPPAKPAPSANSRIRVLDSANPFTN